MPIDRQTNHTSWPLKPSLAAARTGKTNLAPRLAPSAASAATTTTTTTTPTVRTPRTTAGSTPRPLSAAHEDVTPVKPFVSANVTPRTSSRKSRVGGASSGNSTPNGTPATAPTVTTRSASALEYAQKEQASLLGHSQPGAYRRPKSVIGGINGHNATPTPRLPLSNIYSPNNASESNGSRGTSASPMFFHANDARTAEPQQPQPQLQPPPPPQREQKRTPVFFYANGDKDAPVTSSSGPSPPLSALGRTQAETKFFHADSLPDNRGSPPVLTPPAATSSPEPWSANLRPSEGQQSLRPPSPAKDNIHLSYRKGASQVMRPNLASRNSGLSIISPTQSHDDANEASTSRRTSIGSPAVRFGHTKSASLSSIDSTRSLKKPTSPEQPHMTPSPLHIDKRVVSNASLPDGMPSVPPSPNVTSPAATGPAGKSMLDHMNELAANARRERKVLDLEISNSSLLAINRSLEREMRKQKAEIRRFRRMSRAGQFAPDAVSHVEEFSAIGASDLGDLSDMSEGEEPPEEEEEEEEKDEGEGEGEAEPDAEEDSDSSFDESAMSEAALAERDEAHRARDEKRLRWDLEKHRELLVDSQKMNQSLKRCLNWTEELIKDGQKALAYRVRISDVHLGGRVLNAEERLDESDSEEEGERAHGALLSPWSPPRTSVAWGEEERTADRDSGVDLGGVKDAGMGLRSFVEGVEG